MQFDSLQGYEPLYGLNIFKKNTWPQMFGPIKIDINCQCLAAEDGEVIQFLALKNLKTGAELLEERRGRGSLGDCHKL